MQLLNQITDNPYQSFRLYTIDNIQLSITLRYLPLMQFWTIDIISPTFTLMGARIVNSFNLLSQWSNIITFGLSCLSEDLQDPFLLTDFSSGRNSIYLLDVTDVVNIETAIKTP